MCIKSSCTKCRSKSHCQEKALRDEIEEYKKLTESLLKEVEESTKLLEIAGEKIEKMKCCQNCKYSDEHLSGDIFCKLAWGNPRQNCERLYPNNTDLWELG